MLYFVISAVVIVAIGLFIINLILNYLFGFDEELLREAKEEMGSIVLKEMQHMVCFLIAMIIIVIVIT